jgi:cytochrome b6-f complex iron-sulfur subunit
MSGHKKHKGKSKQRRPLVKRLRQVDQQAGGSMTRRSFLQISLTVLGAMAALEVGGASLLYLRSRSLEGEFGGVITAGNVEDFATGSVTEFKDGNFYLVREDNGGFLALYRRCPHLGCTVNWEPEEGKFFCPCHASSFDQVGNFQNQLVTRALDTFKVKIEGSQVKIDTTQVIQRERFEPEQLSYR